MANTQTTVPTFVPGQVLEASQLVNSAATGVPVFATTVTRDAGFGGAGEKALAEGQLCYLESTNVVQYYDGAAWATLAPAPAASSGLTFITGGSVSGTTSVNNCFSATYQNYKLVFNTLVNGTNTEIRFRYRVGGTDNTAANYTQIGAGQDLSGPFQTIDPKISVSYHVLSTENSLSDGRSFSFDVMNPFEAKNTNYGPMVDFYGSLAYGFLHGGYHVSATSFDGFTIFPGTSTLTGTYKVYGYANS